MCTSISVGPKLLSQCLRVAYGQKWLCIAIWLLASASSATETENLGIAVLPAPGAVAIDGKFDDWDLSGGVFVCGDVENNREKLAVWIHAMYDPQYLYILARWIDETPLNNPGSIRGDFPFNGDCLQFRTITGQGAPEERGQHFSAWRDRDAIDAIKIEQGVRFKEGVIADAKTQGARQAFRIDDDKRGYVQEIALPWSLLTHSGKSLQAGDTMTLTVEPNFTVGAGGRHTIKDIFKPGSNVDRVFTFMSSQCWGPAVLEAKGGIAPRPLRLADARELPVAMVDHRPVVDWSGLGKARQTPGVKSIVFELPRDGYVSMHLRDASGTVVRHLLNAEFRNQGRNEVSWDGLDNPLFKKPGDVLPAGSYTWRGIWHQGIGLRLRGWACNGGNAPWDNGPTTNWGGDHGMPTAAAADGDTVYLGWNGSEAGRALVACDLDGNVKWKHTRGAFGGVLFVAADGGTVFAVDGFDNSIYCLNPETGVYGSWAGTQQSSVRIADLWGEKTPGPDRATGFDVLHGKAYLACPAPAQGDFLAVVDVKSGKVLNKWKVPDPGRLKAVSDRRVYVLSGGKALLALNPLDGTSDTVIDGLSNAVSVAVGSDGKLFVGTGAPDQQVKVFSAAGKPLGAIGLPGGRPELGPWTARGMSKIAGIAVDRLGRLWVTEANHHPKRVALWDKDGKLLREFFGPTHYGASGGAILPDDPNVMVGEGCEWKLDPLTGRAGCTGVFDLASHNFAKFCRGGNGRVYLVVATEKQGGLKFYERLGEGRYQLRATITRFDKEKTTSFWSDRHGDGQPRDEETEVYPAPLTLGGYYYWSVGIGRDLTLVANMTGYYDPDTKGEGLLLRVKEFTACGAPVWDLARPTKLPPTCGGVPSADGRWVINQNGPQDSKVWCNEVSSGRRWWWYPSQWAGVHGSHLAPPPAVGLLRGVFGCIGTATLPEPLGQVFVFNSNVGEFHVLTAGGFYVTRLFQPDPLKFVFPEKAVPGAVADNLPSGMGGEDFGGSMTQAADGKIYIQSGKTALWNLEVVGLDGVRVLPGSGGSVTLAPADLARARALRDQRLQAATGTQRLRIKRLTPKFTGNLEADFPGGEIVRYKKQDDAEARSAAAWDDANLYLGWHVSDKTPWQNGATDAALLYTGGDTVDFQIGADPKADKNRADAAAGDLRLSIGNFQGTPTAMLYRKVSEVKRSRAFSSGVIRNYVMDFVDSLPQARIAVKLHAGQGYVVEAAVPLASLGLKPADGLTLRGDFGVTHGDPAGQRTRLRTHWNNQHTGIVDDIVFELQMEPKNWGEMTFVK